MGKHILVTTKYLTDIVAKECVCTSKPLLQVFMKPFLVIPVETQIFLYH